MQKRKRYTTIKLDIPLSIKLGIMRQIGESKQDVIKRLLHKAKRMRI